MEREKRNQNKRKYLRLLMIVLSSYSFIFAAPALINIEYFPKVASVSNTFTIKFYMDSPLTSTPKIILNDDGILSLEAGNVFIENGGTVIESQYKINKIGLIKLEHILLYIEDKRIEVPTIELEVKANLLSKDTQFRTRILKYTKMTEIAKENSYDHNAKQPLVLGDRYFILIEGLFEKKEEKKISIQYELPENAFIEKLKAYPLEFQEDEIWKPVAMFLWIPLKKGMQTLPLFNLTLDISKTQEYKLALEQMTVKVLAPEKKRIEKNEEKEVFQNYLSEALLDEEHSSKQHTEKEIEIATEIKELREKERSSFFYADLKKKRIEKEKELGLENSFSVFHYKLYIMSIIIAIIFLSYPILKKIFRKKPFNFYDVLSFFIAIFILAYGIKINDFRKEYTLSNIESNDNIYISPEENSTILEHMSVGETVKIVYTSEDWIFIETNKNIKGWCKSKK